MVININPNRVNVRSGSTGKPTDQSQREPEALSSPYTVPKRSDVNHIPNVESLKTLIGSAVSALRKGVYWDRGTILNLLV